MFFSLLLGSYHPLEDSICLDESCCFSTYPVNYKGTLVSFVVSSRIAVILSNRVVGVIMGGLLQ